MAEVFQGPADIQWDVDRDLLDTNVMTLSEVPQPATRAVSPRPDVSRCITRLTGAAADGEFVAMGHELLLLSTPVPS